MRNRSHSRSTPRSRSAAERAPIGKPVAQLVTKIKHTKGAYNYHWPHPGGSEVVGISMRAQLDPGDSVHGSETGDNNGAQQALMTSVNHFVASDMVRGHLLNANLGGDAVPGNLYPITSQANAHHKTKAEYAVKNAVKNGLGARYEVDVVNAAHNDQNPDADFRCRAWSWNPAPAPNGVLGQELFNVTIQSRPNAAQGARGASDDNKNPGHEPASHANPGNPANWVTSNPNDPTLVRNRQNVTFLDDGLIGHPTLDPSKAGPAPGWSISSFCFITTAVAERRGLRDDCRELTVLRRFRDTWLAARPEGPALIREYYRVAPPILRAIRRHRDRDDILLALYGDIATCIAHIGAGRPEAAFAGYVRMVRALQHRFLG